MKRKTIYVTLLLLFLNIFARSQSLMLTDQQGNPIAPDATIVQSGSPDHGTFYTYLNVTNTSTYGLAVKCKKTEISMLDSTKVFMCWAGVCYAATIFTSTNSQPIGPGDTYTDFSGTYHQIAYHPYLPGESIVRWTFFDAANPDDSVSVTVIYATWPVGISDQAIRESGVSAFPNPAGDKITIIARRWNDQPAEVQIHDLTGAMVTSIPANINSGRIEMSTTHLKDGVYVCILKSARKSEQVRLVVSRRKP